MTEIDPKIVEHVLSVVGGPNKHNGRRAYIRAVLVASGLEARMVAMEDIIRRYVDPFDVRKEDLPIINEIAARAAPLDKEPHQP